MLATPTSGAIIICFADIPIFILGYCLLICSLLVHYNPMPTLIKIRHGTS